MANKRLSPQVMRGWLALLPRHMQMSARVAPRARACLLESSERKSETPEGLELRSRRQFDDKRESVKEMLSLCAHIASATSQTERTCGVVWGEEEKRLSIFANSR